MDQSSGGQIMGMLAANTADVGYFVRLGHIVSSPRDISARGVSLALTETIISRGKG